MLISKSRLLFDKGQFADSLKALEEAYNLDPKPKTARQITRLKEYLFTEEENKNNVDTEENARNKAADLEKKARLLYHDNDYHGTLDLLLQAEAIYPSEKLRRRIDRLEKLLAERRAEGVTRFYLVIHLCHRYIT